MSRDSDDAPPIPEVPPSSSRTDFRPRYGHHDGPARADPHLDDRARPHLSQPPASVTLPDLLRYGHHRPGAHPLNVTARTSTRTEENKRALVPAARSARAVLVVDENGRPVENARLEILQRLLRL